MQAKISVMLPAANPASARVLEELGANTINVPVDLSLAQLAAIRAAIDVPLDVYVESPDNLGGIVRMHEIAEIVRVARPGPRQVRPAQRARPLSLGHAPGGDRGRALARAGAPGADRARPPGGPPSRPPSSARAGSPFRGSQLGGEDQLAVASRRPGGMPMTRLNARANAASER